MTWPALFRRKCRVSVVCSTYRPGGLSWPARSLREQTRPPDEVVFVCDGLSLDAALNGSPIPSSLRNAVRTHTVLLDRPPDAPFAPSLVHNAGIDRATGDVLLLMCDNTYVPPRWVETNLELLDHHKPALLAHGVVLHWPDTEAHQDTRLFARQDCPCAPMIMPMTPLSPEIAIQGGRAKDSGWSAFGIELPLLRKIGGFDERLIGGYGYDERLVNYRAELHSGRLCMVSMHPDVVSHRFAHDREGRSTASERSLAENWEICSTILNDPEELRRPALRWSAP